MSLGEGFGVGLRGVVGGRVFLENKERGRGWGGWGAG